MPSWSFHNRGVGRNIRQLNKWLESFELYSIWRTPSFMHKPDIHHGYRPSPVTWWYCVKSLVTPSNEFLNVWIYLLVAVLLVLINVEFLKNDLRGIHKGELFIVPWYMSVVGSLSLAVFGAVGHLFNCMDIAWHEVCQCAEYSALGMHSVGTVTAFSLYICPYSCIINQPGIFVAFYIGLASASVAAIGMACQARMPKADQRLTFRIQVFTGIYCVVMLPCALKYLWMDEPERIPHSVKLNSGNVCNIALGSQYDFICSSCAMIIGAVLQYMRMPETRKPGQVDILGHSHQLFHLGVATSMYYESSIVNTALKEIIRLNRVGSLTRTDMGVNKWTCLYVPVVLTTAAIGVGASYAKELHTLFNRNRIRRTLDWCSNG